MENLIDKAIEIIRKADNEIYEVESQHLHLIAESVASSDIPKTGSILLGLFAAINSIKLGILDLSENLEIYSVKCLYRVLLEHFIKTNYIFYEFIKTKTDEVGGEYLIFSKASDVIGLAKSYNQMKKFIQQVTDKIDDYDIICSLSPEYKSYPRKNALDKINRFRRVNMLRTLITAGEEKENNPFVLLLRTMPEYSELSAFIHGNPSALLDVQKHYSNDTLQKESVRCARAAFNVTVVSKRLILIALGQIDERVFVVDRGIAAVWDDFGKRFERIEKIISI